jgi:hypothetical protein
MPFVLLDAQRCVSRAAKFSWFTRRQGFGAYRPWLSRFLLRYFIHLKRGVANQCMRLNIDLLSFGCVWIDPTHCQ